jgi:RHS repeat-associated protein
VAPASNVTAVTEYADTATADEIECYRYDGHRRLTEAWTRPGGTNCVDAPSLAGLGGPAPYWHSWSYTSAGTIDTFTLHASGGNVQLDYAYPAAGGVRPHAVSSVTNGPSVRPYTYDAAGNTTSRINPTTGNTQTFAWDVEGRMSSVTEDAKTSTHVYDANGELLIRRDPAETILYLGDTELHRSSAGALSGVRYYRFGGKTVMVRTTATGRNWLITDQHDTPLVSVQADTHTVTRRRENPFGRPRTTPSSWPSTRGFVGGETNSHTDLVHLGARDYDPYTGLFASVDPLLDPTDLQSLNAYSYANNNPVTSSDPTGLRTDWGGEGGAPCHGCSPPGDPEYGDWSDSGGPTPEQQRARDSNGGSSTGTGHRRDGHSTGGTKTARIPAALADFSSITRSLLDWLRGSSTGSDANLLALAPAACGARMVGMCGGGGSLGRIPNGTGNGSASGTGSGKGFFGGLRDFVNRLVGKRQPVNAAGVPYPKVIDPRTGKDISHSLAKN